MNILPRSIINFAQKLYITVRTITVWADGVIRISTQFSRHFWKSIEDPTYSFPDNLDDLVE